MGLLMFFPTLVERDKTFMTSINLLPLMPMHVSNRGKLLTLLHSERPKLHRVLAILSATGLNGRICS